MTHWIVLTIIDITIGIGNGILKHFLEWVDERREKLPPDLLDSRQSVVGFQVDLEEYMEETLEEWNHEGGSELAGLLFEKTAVAELVAERDVGGLLAMLADKRAEAEGVCCWLDQKDRCFASRKKSTLMQLVPSRRTCKRAVSFQGAGETAWSCSSQEPPAIN